MNRTGPVAVVALLVLLSVATPALGTPATAGEPPRWQQTTTTSADGNATTTGGNETSPGTRLGGVVAAQGVAVGSEVESRSLRHQLNRSTSNESKATVLARQVNQSQSRLDALRAERERLEAASENGTISESEYRIRATRLSARIDAIRRLNDQTVDVAERLPQETLERNGVNVTALRSVRSMADEAEGPEIAAIARDIAGPQRGLGPPDDDEERGRSDERGANGAGSDARGRDTDERPGNGPPDDARGRSTGNETTGDGAADDPTPRGNAQGESNGSAGERGQGTDGENAGNGNAGSKNAGNDGDAGQGNSDDGDNARGNDDAGNSGNNGAGNGSADDNPGKGDGNDDAGDNRGEGRGNDDAGNNAGSGNGNDDAGNGKSDDAGNGKSDGRGNGGNGNPGRAAIR